MLPVIVATPPVKVAPDPIKEKMLFVPNPTTDNKLSKARIDIFAFTNKLNPDKKQPIFETMQLIKQNKDSNTLVVFGTDEILPTIAYNYNRAYFAAMQDEKEYHLTDSLLRADNVYCTYNAEEIKPLIGTKFTKVIYIGLDEKTNAADYPIVNLLNASYNLIKQDKLGDGRWQMSFYDLRKS